MIVNLKSLTPEVGDVVIICLGLPLIAAVLIAIKTGFI